MTTRQTNLKTWAAHASDSQILEEYEKAAAKGGKGSARYHIFEWEMIRRGLLPNPGDT